MEDIVEPLGLFHLLLSASTAVILLSWILDSEYVRPRKWPVVPGSLPIVGNWLGPGGPKNLAHRFCEWAERYGEDKSVASMPSNPSFTKELVECQVFGTKYFLVASHALASKVISRRPYKMILDQKLTHAARSIGADGLFVAEGHDWRKDRKIVAPAMTPKKITDHVSQIKLVASRLVGKWKKQLKTTDTITINLDMVAFTVDSIGLIALESDLGALTSDISQEAKDLRRAFQGLWIRVLSPIEYWKIPLIGDYVDGMMASKRRLQNSCRKAIRKEEARYLETKSPSPSLLGRIIAQSHEETKPMSAYRVLGNIMTLYGAGTDTTASSMMMGLWKIVNDPSGLQDELAEEALAFENFDSEDLTLQGILDNLPRLRSLFYEILRVIGPAPLLFLEATEPFEVEEDIVFPVGSKVVVPLRHLAHLSSAGAPVGPQQSPPDVFCPRRWRVMDETGEKVTGTLKPSAKEGMALATGFGAGPRVCPGQYLAESEFLIGLGTILRHFELSKPEDHPPVQMMTTFASTADRDIQLIVRPRQT